MRPPIWLRTTVLAAVILVVGTGSAGADVITGTVKTAGGTPIGGSRVDALQVMGGGVYELRASAFVSRADGSYAIADLPAGTYVVRFQGNGTYMREHFEDVPNRSLATQLVVGGATIAGIDAVLAPWPKLNGRITTTAGAPVPGATVTVMRAPGEIEVGSASAAADGSYALTLRDDQAGVSTYKLRFDDPLGLQLGEWHLDKPSFSSADALALPPGSVTSIDAALTQAGFIAGRLTDSDGDPLAGAAVHVSRLDGAVVQRIETAADGTYATAGLTPGSYALHFGLASLYLVPEYYDDQENNSAADPVVVTAGVTSVADAVLQHDGAISGRVTGVSGEPLDFARVLVYTPTGTLVGLNHTGADGRYLIGQVPPGDYKVRFEPSGGDGAAQWYSAKATLAGADPVTVVKGATTTGIDASVGVGGRIAGTVGVAGGLASPVSVDLFDADGRQMASTLTRNDATYAIDGLLPGTYRIRFTPIPESGLLTEFHDDKQTLDTADPVAVSDGVTTTVDVTLEPGKAITGHVTRTDGQPVREVAVVVYDDAGASVRTAHTDAAGDYTAAGLLPGSYRVRFVGPGSPEDVDYHGDIPADAGYVESEFHLNKATLAAADPVSVSAATTTLNATLASTGVIRGTVRTATGATLKGARVYLVRTDSRRAGPFLTTWKGQYRADGLRPGQWKVFFASPYTAYESAYYDAEPTLATADPVTVSERVTVTGIDAALVRRPALVAPFALVAPGL